MKTNFKDQNNIIVHLYTLCRNEIERLPFAIKYWEKCASHVYVYLMSSTDDGSREYLQQFPDFITIEEINDEDGFNDKRNQILKNSIWKKSRNKADFVIVTDFDEFIYNPSLLIELQYMKENEYTIIKPRGYQLITKNNKIIEKQNLKTLLHEQIKYYFEDNNYAKCCIFDPNQIKEIRYSPGAHQCQPIGNVKYLE